MVGKNTTKKLSGVAKKTGASITSTPSDDIKLKLVKLENKYLDLANQIEDLVYDFQKRLSEFKKIEKALKENFIKKQDEKKIREILSKIK